jgi:hypothetical protein
VVTPSVACELAVKRLHWPSVAVRLPLSPCLDQDRTTGSGTPAPSPDRQGTRRGLRAVELGLPFDDIAPCAAHARVP